MQKIIGLVMVVMVAATLFACGPLPAPTQRSAPASTPPVAPTPTPVPTPAPAPIPEPSLIRITAVDLWEAYNANEVAADAIYRGNVLEISGRIDEIGKDWLDNPYINLRTKFSEIILPYPHDSIVMTEGRVKCMFDSKEESQLTQLAKGQEVTVRGECSGYNYYVEIIDCTLLSVTQTRKLENQEQIFTIEIEKSTLIPPRQFGGQELPASNLAVTLGCSTNEEIYVHTMVLRSDIAEETCYVGLALGLRGSTTSHLYLPYKTPMIEVRLLGLNEEVLFHEAITIED